MRIRFAMMLCAVTAVVGCAATPVGTGGRAGVGGTPLKARPYTIGIGDRLRFEAPPVPELHEEEATVRDDGTVDLPLLGAMFAAGRTPAQLGSEVHERLRRFYVAPAVRVSVFIHESQTWFAESGPVRVTRPYTGRDQPDDALDVMRVSGWAPVRVYRPDESGKLQPVDLGKEPLEAGDVVQIGSGSVAKAGK